MSEKAPTPLTLAIGARIRQARHDRGWSLDQAEEASMDANRESGWLSRSFTASTLGAYERAYREPSASVLLDLAELYQCGPGWLLTGNRPGGPIVVTADDDYLRGAVRSFLEAVTGGAL
jgi:transcriptional regulator with XRE-family HTH domain